MEWAAAARPARGQVPANDLEWKVDEYCNGKVLLAKTFLDHLETGSCIMRRPSNFSEEVHKNDRFDIYYRSEASGVLTVPENLRPSFTMLQIVL
jgi:hypothetical protein